MRGHCRLRSKGRNLCELVAMKEPAIDGPVGQCVDKQALQRHNLIPHIPCLNCREEAYQLENSTLSWAREIKTCKEPKSLSGHMDQSPPH